MNLPTADQLKEKINREMLPPNLKVTERGARVSLKDASHHFATRVVLR